ncbi:MAG: hypothetical protein ACTS4Z_00165 [Candidatus Hodgkinia cicadicola]
MLRKVYVWLKVNKHRQSVIRHKNCIHCKVCCVKLKELTVTWKSSILEVTKLAPQVNNKFKLGPSLATIYLISSYFTKMILLPNELVSS